jgi:hypothetical protein
VCSANSLSKKSAGKIIKTKKSNNNPLTKKEKEYFFSNQLLKIIRVISDLGFQSTILGRKQKKKPSLISHK